MARRSKYTPETQKRVLDAIEMGATYELAANYAGISYELLRQWMRDKVAFLEAMKAAEGKGAYTWLRKIEAAASDGNWQAAAWKLERRYPQQYGRTVQEHSGEHKLTIEYTNDWRSHGGAQAAREEGDDATRSATVH